VGGTVSRADTGLVAQRSTVAGWVPPKELVEQRWGVIPRRVRVVARPCGVRAFNARTRRWEQARVGAFERGGPRSRGRLALERGGPRPRVRLAVPPWWAAGATMVPIVLCACIRFEVGLCFALFCRF
jgi:hypothetical protein